MAFAVIGTSISTIQMLSTMLEIRFFIIPASLRNYIRVVFFYEQFEGFLEHFYL